MDFGLSEEQRLIVDSLRAFVERELYPHEAEVERLGRVPPDLARSIREKAIAQGFYAANMPAEHGGAGLDAVTVTLMDMELGRASYALNHLVARPYTVLRACEGHMVDAFLRPTVRGEKVECIAMTEPEAGSDLRCMRTFAARDGDDYVINGTKHFISKADIADFVILFAATGSEETPRGTRARISCIFVDKATPGLTVRPGYTCISHRGYNNFILEFDDCRVPARNLLGAEHGGLDLAKTWLGATRVQVAAMAVGRARRATDLAGEWAVTRRQFGQPIGDFQGVAFKLADMATEIRAAEVMTLASAWALDQGTAGDSDAAMTKLFATEMLGRVADQAVQIHGGMGLMEETPVARIWRDARVERIWDGTSEVQRHMISRAMLKSYGG